MYIAACHLTLTAHKDCRWPHLQVRSVDNFYRDGQKKCQFKWSIWSQKCSQNVTWWSLHLKTENKCCFQPNRSILSSRKQDWRCKSGVEYSPGMCKARGSVPRAIKISNIINRQTNSTERMYRTGEWTTRLIPNCSARTLPFKVSMQQQSSDAFYFVHWAYQRRKGFSVGPKGLLSPWNLIASQKSLMKTL